MAAAMLVIETGKTDMPVAELTGQFCTFKTTRKMLKDSAGHWMELQVFFGQFLVQKFIVKMDEKIVASNKWWHSVA